MAYPLKLRENRTIFMHVPKCAGQAVGKQAKDRCESAGVTMQRLIVSGIHDVFIKRTVGTYVNAQENPEWDEGFARVALVRHPFDRFLSAYRMFCMGTRYKGEKLFMPRFPGLTIDQAIELLLDDSVVPAYDPHALGGFRFHMLPMSHPEMFLDNTACVKYERWASDGKEQELFMQLLGFPPEEPKDAPRTNTTGGYLKRSPCYTRALDMLSQDHRKRLAGVYAEDLHRFDYDIP